MSGPRRRAALALLLLVPVPSLGTAAALVLARGPLGNALFVVAKVWIVAFPAVWFLGVERGRAGLSPPRRGGLTIGAVWGVAMAAVVVVAGVLLGARVDVEGLRRAAATIGIATPGAYLAGAAYWIFVNSVVEEYVYRWFVLSQLERLVRAPAAVLGSAVVFTLHHVIALQAYLEPAMTALASSGVLAGGALWALLYQRHRSIWPPWVSHALVDVAVFGIGAWLLFGAGSAP